MEKGKYKKQRKYLSIVFIPHSPDHVRMLKLSAPQSKVVSLFAVIITAVVCLSMLLTHTLQENRRLRSNLTVLTSSSIEQQMLLNEKSTEIQRLKTIELNKKDVLQEFMNKYNEITDTYINNRIDAAKASRSGSRSDRSFVDDVNELKGILSSLRNLEDLGESSLASLTQTEQKLQKYLETVPTLTPTGGRISSTFGTRRDPIRGRKSFHEGLDIAADYGQSIKAAAGGTVIFSGRNSGYGNCIIINHGHGISTLYGHASKLLIKEGAAVKKGDVIAKVGSSGRSTGPHLHYEVRINDTQVDPLKYMD
jgi:murein DD-endopeptidase MepM/ murein hydrolase activator NlpD